MLIALKHTRHQLLDNPNNPPLKTNKNKNKNNLLRFEKETDSDPAASARTGLQTAGQQDPDDTEE